MIYLYCRKSKQKQNIERQIRNLTAEYPLGMVIEEAYSGTTINRPKWSKLFNTVREGDTIVFDSVSRMSRNAEEGFEAYETLYHRGVNLVFLKEKHINTDTFKTAIKKSIPMTGTTVDYILEGINKYLLELAKEQIKIAFEQSEKEVSDLHQRTKEGIETARLNGKQIGQPKGAKLTVKKSITAKAIIKKHSKDFSGSLADEDVIKLCGISRKTYYKYKKELREE